MIKVDRKSYNFIVSSLISSILHQKKIIFRVDGCKISFVDPRGTPVVIAVQFPG